MMKKIPLLLLGFGLIFFATSAKADFYLHPRAGATIPLKGGDPAYTLGGALGYEWNQFFSTEISYARLFGTGNAADGDLVKGEGIFSLPLPIVTPYVSAGVGFVHASLPGKDSIDPMVVLGAGATLTKIAFLSLGAGVSYAMVKNSGDFVEPYVSVGINF